MEAYKIVYEAVGRSTSVIHVSAVTCGRARYQAFDEIVDRGIRLSRFVAVLAWDECASDWVKPCEHVDA